MDLISQVIVETLEYIKDKPISCESALNKLDKDLILIKDSFKLEEEDFNYTVEYYEKLKPILLECVSILKGIRTKEIETIINSEQLLTYKAIIKSLIEEYKGE